MFESIGLIHLGLSILCSVAVVGFFVMYYFLHKMTAVASEALERNGCYKKLLDLRDKRIRLYIFSSIFTFKYDWEFSLK